jgi:PAS domain S-box-containing protein
VSYTDVTESNRVLEELNLNKNYLEKLTHSMTDIVFSVKMPERKIEWVNHSIATIGYNPSECIGKVTSFLFPTQESYVYYGIKVKEAIINKKDFLQIRQKLIKKNGEKFTADIITSFIIEKNNVIRVTSIIRDISSKIKEEKELKKYRNHLEELVIERTQKLKEKNQALDESLKVFVGREQKIKKLEEQIQELKKNQLVN